jgi:hypothetical protein
MAALCLSIAANTGSGAAANAATAGAVARAATGSVSAVRLVDSVIVGPPFPCLYPAIWVIRFKMSTKSVEPKKRGRGRPATGRDTVRALRISDELLAAIDRWAATRETSRSEAIRRLVELGLKAPSRRVIRRG